MGESKDDGDTSKEVEQRDLLGVLKSWIKAVLDLLWVHWFLVGLGVAIGLAAAVPNVAKSHGYIRSEWSIKYGAVIVIFLLSGAGLKTRVLINAAASWRIHIATQALSLVAMPALGYGIGKGMWMSKHLNRDLVTGFIIAQCTSTTASTNVVFTAAAGGNESLALVNAVIGNLIGIFLTPAWLLTYLSAEGSIPYGKVIIQVIETILIPLVVGQLFQYKFPDLVKKAQGYINFNKTGSLMILLLVWATFSNQFAKHVKVDAGSVIAVTFINLGLYVFFQFLALILPLFPPVRLLLKTNEADAIAMSMVVSTKTVALGIPIISAVYGSNKRAGLYSLPLIIYHAEQILLGSLVTAPMKRWKERRMKTTDNADDSVQKAPQGEVRDDVEEGAQSKATDNGSAVRVSGHLGGHVNGRSSDGLDREEATAK